MGTMFGEICTSGLGDVPGARAFLAKFGLGGDRGFRKKAAYEGLEVTSRTSN